VLLVLLLPLQLEAKQNKLQDTYNMADPYTFTFDVDAFLSGQEVEKETPPEGVMKRPAKEAEAKSDTPTESLMTRLATALKSTFPDSPALGATPQGDNSSGRNKALTDWTISTEAFIPKYRGDVPAAMALQASPVTTTDMGPDMGTLAMQDAQEQSAIRSVTGITESLGRPQPTAMTDVAGLTAMLEGEADSGVTLPSTDSVSDMYPTQGLMSPPVQDTVSEVATDTAELGISAQTQGLINRPLTAEERTSLSDVGGMAAKAYLEDKGLDQDLFDSFEATSTYAKQKGWSTQKTPHVPMFTSAEKRKAMTVLDSVADSVYEDAPELVAALKTIMDHESGGKLAELGYAYLTGADLAAKINASNNPTSTTEQRSRLRALTAMENSAEYRNGDREKKDMMIFDVYYDDQHRSDGYKMGNTEEGDGSKYRGRGIIQLTGKNNYKKYGDMIGVDLVNNPDYMQNRPDVMIAASLAYLEDKGLNEGTLSARKMAKVVGHADSEGKPEARARWDDVISSIEAAGNQALADDMRLNDEYLAQETVGATVDGIIGTNSEREMTEWLGRPPRNITVPEGTSTIDKVRMVNMESNP
tara:strand:+ start:4065 stop:5822 length:1758 start_codon:yes stop_codon:yes gene_type:complete